MPLTVRSITDDGRPGDNVGELQVIAEQEESEGVCLLMTLASAKRRTEHNVRRRRP